LINIYAFNEDFKEKSKIEKKGSKSRVNQSEVIRMGKMAVIFYMLSIASIPVIQSFENLLQIFEPLFIFK